jgi:hypothetical protein
MEASASSYSKLKGVTAHKNILNVNLSLCLIKHHAMKTDGRVEV